MQHLQLHENLSVSRIMHGWWRMHEWNLNALGCLDLIHAVLDTGIDTFDHAACYGGFTNEGAFGRALAADKSLRNKMTIVSKCGISFPNDALPDMKSKFYDNSAEHIIWSAERSVRELCCGHLDILLLHRPSPFADPAEIAAAFDNLHSRGIVRFFGVSNYTPAKLSMLQSYLAQPLVTNQIEVSPLHLQPFEDGSIDFLMEKRIRPTAWSPLAGGALFDTANPQSRRVLNALLKAGEAHNEQRPDTLAYAWLLNHPSGMAAIAGSGNPERIRNAADAVNIRFSAEEWIGVYAASLGHDVP